jgi:hypothetical protein
MHQEEKETRAMLEQPQEPQTEQAVLEEQAEMVALS